MAPDPLECHNSSALWFISYYHWGFFFWFFLGGGVVHVGLCVWFSSCWGDGELFQIFKRNTISLIFCINVYTKQLYFIYSSSNCIWGYYSNSTERNRIYFYIYNLICWWKNSITEKMLKNYILPKGNEFSFWLLELSTSASVLSPEVEVTWGIYTRASLFSWLHWSQNYCHSSQQGSNNRLIESNKKYPLIQNTGRQMSLKTGKYYM